MGDLVPFVRVADAEASARWYAALGFVEDGRHRFADGLPLWLSMRRGDARIFLSEHEGDARPDTLLYLYVEDVDTTLATLAAFGNVPDAYDAPWGMRETEVRDPDGNRIRIGSPLGGRSGAARRA